MSQKTKHRFAPLVALLFFVGVPLIGCDSGAPAEKPKDKGSPAASSEKPTHEAEKPAAK